MIARLRVPAWSRGGITSEIAFSRRKRRASCAYERADDHSEAVRSRRCAAGRCLSRSGRAATPHASCPVVTCDVEISTSMMALEDRSDRSTQIQACRRTHGYGSDRSERKRAIHADGDRSDPYPSAWVPLSLSDLSDPYPWVRRHAWICVDLSDLSLRGSS